MWGKILFSVMFKGKVDWNYEEFVFFVFQQSEKWPTYSTLWPVMDHNAYESHLKANSMKLHILKPEVRQKSEIHTVEDLIKAKTTKVPMQRFWKKNLDVLALSKRTT